MILKLFGFQVSELSDEQKLVLEAAVRVFIQAVRGQIILSPPTNKAAEELAKIIDSYDNFDDQLRAYREWVEKEQDNG